MDESNTPELRGRMFSELAQYVAPKRKAIEMQAELHAPGPRVVIVSAPDASDAIEDGSGGLTVVLPDNGRD